MAGPFDPKRLMGQLSKPLLREFFETRNVSLGVDWEQLPEKRYGSQVFEAWTGLAPEDQQRLEPELIDVDHLAEERAVRGVVEAAADMGGDLHDELEQYESLPDRIMHVLLKHPRLWRNIQSFVELDLLVTKRFWYTYPGFATGPIDDVEGKLPAFEKAVGKFYNKLDGRGRIHDCQHHVRNGRIEYFFIQLDSYRRNTPAVDEDGRIAPQPQHPVFNVVFVFHREAGILELMAQGGKKVREPLLKLFCNHMLGVEPPSEYDGPPSYQLNVLLDLDKTFDIEPGDGIERVYLQALRFWMVGQGGRRITLEGDLNLNARDVYRMISDLFRDGPVALRDYRVAGAKFKFKFDSRGPIKKRSVTFEVSSPRSDSFKDEPEQVRAVIERCLRRWGIDENQPAEQPAEPVAAS